MSNPPLYNSFLISFLIAPRYRFGRHLLLILFFTFVAFNMPYLTCAAFLDRVDEMIWAVNVALLLSYLGGIYLHMYVLLPALLLKNRYLFYTLAVSVLLLAMIGVSFGADYWLNRYYRQEPGHYSFFYKNRILAVEIVSNFFLYALLIAGTSVTILLRHWMRFYRRRNELEKAKLKTELELLKDRINPEFLFDMLDEAALRTLDRPAQASGVLMELSRLLRYQLYDGKREQVLLISEIAFIERFLKLATARHPGLNFTVAKEGEVSRKLVPPLLFIPFAIHYVKSIPPGDVRTDVHICFRATGREVSFSSSCSSFAMPVQDSEELRDVKHRLDLLFKDSYSLATACDGHRCTTRLSIAL